MPYFGLTSAFLSSPLLEKCAPYSGFGVRHAPVKVCGLLRSYCAPCSGFCSFLDVILSIATLFV